MAGPPASEAHTLDYRTALASSLARLMGTWWAPSFHAAMARSAGFDLGATASRVLWELSFSGTARPTELAERIGIGAPSVSKAVSTLVHAGWLERSSGSGDRRTASLQLTPAGTEVARGLIEAGDRMIDAITEGWSPDEVAEATRVTARLEAGAIAYAASIAD